MKLIDRIQKRLNDLFTEVDEAIGTAFDVEANEEKVEEIRQALPDPEPTPVKAAPKKSKATAKADEAWKKRARILVAEFAATGKVFTSDDVMLKLEEEGVTTSEPRALGVIFRSMAKRGDIKRVGYITSTRRKGAPAAQWQG